MIARKEEELHLAREIMEKEEANFQLNEQYTSLQEACQSITKKLKKLWKKYQQAKDEIKDLNSEFQTERMDMLSTIRDLNSQMKLKDLIISNFIPPKYARKLSEESKGGLEEWNEAEEEWIIPRLDLACYNLVDQISSIRKGAFCPEAKNSRRSRQNDPALGWRYDNVMQLQLETPLRRRSSNIKNILDMYRQRFDGM